MKQALREMESCLDPQLWHACAGGMVQMPPLHSKIFYFPQGHAEHAHGSVDFGMFCNVPPYVPCRVSSVKYMADPDTDEVYAKISLTPLRNDEIHTEHDVFIANNGLEKPASFAKTLTQSDANNGGGFSVPRYCAETIFPRLDYNADPPVQTILVKDVHAQIWKFRHIYRGTPRRHLLTTGWSNFVNQKKLVAGDSIVFLRAEDGDLCVGIRRAKRGIGGGPESSSGWNSSAGNFDPLYGGHSIFLREGENKLRGTTKSYGESRGKGKVRAESVIEAAKLASNGKSFEVVYYPRASTPEFCVKASSVIAAMQIQWRSGMRFKMAFETEDSSRISWFMGTISSVQVADPIPWPNSPWRLLQVAWDEPDLLQNVKRVSPWLAELVSHIPAIHLSPFSPPRKKLRLPYPDYPLINQIPLPSFSNNPQRPCSPMFCLPLDNNISAGIQGARHDHDYNLSSSDTLHLKKMQLGYFPIDYGISIPPRIQNYHFLGNSKNNEDVACLLSMGNCLPIKKLKKDDVTKMTPVFLLFGQPILTEEQISRSTSGGGDTVGTISSTDENLQKTPKLSNGKVENSSDDGLFPRYKNQLNSEFNFESSQCKVFLDSEDVGRVLDLRVLESYEELYRKLANMFGMEGSEMLSNVMYQDISGSIKNIGDEPFSDFLGTARKLTILTD